MNRIKDAATMLLEAERTKEVIKPSEQKIFLESLLMKRIMCN